MAFSLDIKIGGSLWSALARRRFPIPRSIMELESGVEPPHSKASRPLTLNLMSLSPCSPWLGLFWVNSRPGLS